MNKLFSSLPLVCQDSSLNNGTEEGVGAPNVEAALNMSATEAQKLASEPRKSTIGQRKPASKVRERERERIKTLDCVY